MIDQVCLDLCLVKDNDVSFTGSPRIISNLSGILQAILCLRHVSSDLCRIKSVRLTRIQNTSQSVFTKISKCHKIVQYNHRDHIINIILLLFRLMAVSNMNSIHYILWVVEERPKHKPACVFIKFPSTAESYK